MWGWVAIGVLGYLSGAAFLLGVIVGARELERRATEADDKELGKVRRDTAVVLPFHPRRVL